jgi:hypothetical protein
MKQWEIWTYLDMVNDIWFSIQRWMNYSSNWRPSIILMSIRKNAPYNDKALNWWTTIIYEWHDIQKNHANWRNPKTTDQPAKTPNWKLTQNWLFFNAAINWKQSWKFEKILVYEKIREWIRTFNGEFYLTDARIENDWNRNVYRYKLEICNNENSYDTNDIQIEHARFIPSHVKQEVWIRDKGRCVKCWATTNLHFDHILPYSKWWNSMDANNIQILCAKCNLSKSNKIE